MQLPATAKAGFGLRLPVDWKHIFHNVILSSVIWGLILCRGYFDLYNIYTSREQICKNHLYSALQAKRNKVLQIIYKAGLK